MDKYPCTYILANKQNGTLYVGVTSHIWQRMSQHKQGTFAGFSKKYHVNKLMFYQFYGTMEQAILREKQLKNWKRVWKINLIETMNPQWQDLYNSKTDLLLEPSFISIP